MMVVDFAVRFQHVNIAGNGHAAAFSKERKAALRFAQRIGSKICEHGHVIALCNKPSQDRNAVIVGMRYHQVPVLAECTDVVAAVRMGIDQQCFGIFPTATAILLNIPGTGADILQEPAALGGIRDHIKVSELRIIMQQHFADIEDDVLDWSGQRLFLPRLKASGMAAEMAFFMTVGSASSSNSEGEDHQPSLVVCLAILLTE
ncbi:hypothetical protein FQZ97_869800 [compost metagenome]